MIYSYSSHIPYFKEDFIFERFFCFYLLLMLSLKSQYLYFFLKSLSLKSQGISVTIRTDQKELKSQGIC